MAENHTKKAGVQALSFELKDVSHTPPLTRHRGRKEYTLGTIKFLHLDSSDMGHREREYVIVNQTDDPGETLEFITRRWNLGAPKLVISLVGGYRTIKQMTTSVKNTFRRELVNAVLSTGAWLTTGGLHHGVMSDVGEALRDYAIGRAMAEHRSVVVMGIAPLSVLKQQHKQKLTAGDQKTVKYKMDASGSTTQANLDPNHTHFIIVNDEGIDGAGAEIEAQSKLLREISGRMIEGSNTAGIPVVSIVLGGGHKRIQAVHEAVVKSKTPVIILEGSGGAADVLAFACRHMNAKDVVNRSGGMTWSLTASLSKAMAKAIKSFNKILAEEFGREKMESMNDNRLLEWCREIAERKDLVTVLSIKSQGVKSINIEENILNALLKSKSGGAKSGSGSHYGEQLHLAAILNRIDLAEQLLKDETSLNTATIRQSLRFALVNDQVKLVRLFLNKGLNLHEYLNTRELTSLYKLINKDTLLYELLEEELGKRERGPVLVAVALRDVGYVIKKLTPWSYQPLYCSDTIADHYYKFPNPARELFIWAVLQGRLEMANVFWRESKAPIGGALLASKLLKEMAKKEHDIHESRRSVKYSEGGELYQELAVGVLDECYLSDRKRTSLIIVRTLTSWGSTNCLDLANSAGNLKFIAHPAVQNMLKEFWMGKLSLSNPNWKVWLCMVFPPALLPFRLKLKEEETDPLVVKSLPRGTSKGTILIRKPVRRTSTSARSPRWLPSLLARGISRDGSVEDTAQTSGFTRRRAIKSSKKKKVEEDPYKVTMMRRVQAFFLVPMVIFLYNVISTFAFLALYSYVLLQGLNTHYPTPLEYVIFVWFISLCTEIIRQIWREDAKSLRQRLSLWLSNFWNIVDVVKSVVFITGCVLRLIPGARKDATIITLAIALIIFYMRLLHIFSANKHLGPKLIMIQKMFADLAVFVSILLVFLVAYGVASEAVLHPGSNNATHQKTLQRVFYRPYIQMFGEGLEAEDNFECNRDIDEDCPENPVFAAILLVIYLFLSNVLLLNLLIAMFNYTFTTVQENTDVYWKYQRYKLIREYYKRPPLPPPFIIMSHLYLLTKELCKKLVLACKECQKSAYCTCCRKRNVYNHDSPPLTQASLHEITTWESVKGEDYLANQQEREQRDTHKRMKNTDRRIIELTESVAKLAGDVNLIHEKLESLQTLLIQKLGPPKELDMCADDAFHDIPDAPTLALYAKAANGERKSPRLKFQKAVESLSMAKETVPPLTLLTVIQLMNLNQKMKPNQKIQLIHDYIAYEINIMSSQKIGTHPYRG
ncbi:transient receptor potential cation channel subfamily M member 2-like [Amphiura filiformis]|uniref:transient receptor potential cation channel subfamily M member 2-like n=1 Tax=Amphiura filiformis TaxID=82378 RepID=UPI003B21FD11